MKGFYDKNSKLDFGMYKGYELGIVYVFDPPYIDWCINNIDKFCITDLNELKEYGVINEKLDWQYKMIGDPSLIPNIDIFDTFQELIDNVDLGEKKYKFSDSTINKNESKFFNKKNVNMEEDDYDEDYESNSNYHDEDDDERNGNYRDDNDDDFDGAYYGYEDQNSWGGGGCGEGFSCDNCPEIGCPSNALN